MLDSQAVGKSDVLYRLSLCLLYPLWAWAAFRPGLRPDEPDRHLVTFCVKFLNLHSELWMRLSGQCDDIGEPIGSKHFCTSDSLVIHVVGRD